MSDENKSKNKQVGLHQIKKLLHSEENHQQNIFINDICDKELVSKIYKKLIPFSNKKINNLIKKGTEVMKKHFSKGGIQMDNRHKKMLNIADQGCSLRA